ncbi:unnamed protein product [Pleuronectes platessa]|uniref:Ankyrin repeat and sterile alpha motif domain containing 1A n=1 Tax=Pleuronectes platessa TaxID=8262 RepID=A0A9N7UWY7_PLEPL|nr:unnamed protein product [Pleuronectes platessa]
MGREGLWFVSGSTPRRDNKRRTWIDLSNNPRVSLPCLVPLSKAPYSPNICSPSACTRLLTALCLHLISQLKLQPALPLAGSCGSRPDLASCTSVSEGGVEASCRPFLQGCRVCPLLARHGRDHQHRWRISVASDERQLCSMKNNDNETPLHCAAQYGHFQVVRLLLEELTDPTMRNNKFETPLDLAALYGRLEVVKLLLCAHPNLLSCNTKKHTPLHLASRNGHLSVVEVLLDAGMDINYETEKGSALHEAALFGKADVVQRLLSAGIDVNITDQKGIPALDTVKDMPSQKSREIVALVLGHMAGKPPDIDLPPPPIPPPQESPSPRRKGEMEKMSELISGLAPGPEEESPYEALYEATSCHSLDSLTSGKSSDRDSGRPDSEAGKKDRLVHTSHPGPGHEEEASSEALYTNSIIDERGEPVEEEDHTYELLLSAQTKVPLPSKESHSHKDENSTAKSSNSVLPQRKPTAPNDLRAPSKTKDSLHLPGQLGPRLPGDNSQPSQEPGVPEVFTGLLHGSSPVFDSGEEPFRLPGVPLPAKGQEKSRKTAKVKEEVVAAATPPPSRPSMAAILTDCDPKAIYATVIKEHRDSGAGAVSAGRMRPPGDLKLARSLSKSDSDLLVSPPSEEDGGLGNRSESVSNCSTGKKRLEKSPSFTSEWDEHTPTFRLPLMSGTQIKSSVEPHAVRGDGDKTTD